MTECGGEKKHDRMYETNRIGRVKTSESYFLSHAPHAKKQPIDTHGCTQPNEGRTKHHTKSGITKT
jgi:hypothetical protein